MIRVNRHKVRVFAIVHVGTFWSVSDEDDFWTKFIETVEEGSYILVAGVEDLLGLLEVDDENRAHFIEFSELGGTELHLECTWLEGESD